MAFGKSEHFGNNSEFSVEMAPAPVHPDRPRVAGCSELSWNARLTLIVSPLFMMSVGLTDTPIAAFVLKLTSSNFHVGLVTGTGGLAQLLVAPCAGYLADKLSRQVVLRFASLLTVLSAGWTFTWVLYFRHRVSNHALFVMILGMLRTLRTPGRRDAHLLQARRFQRMITGIIRMIRINIYT